MELKKLLGIKEVRIVKILKLTAENIQKIRAVEITPDGNTVIISGKNGQGKTSVLDSISYALGGKALISQKPIRKGQESAKVVVDLGKYIVERNWTSDNRSYLKVSSKEGGTFASPQKLLDSLIGDLSFDPLAFARAEKKPQVEILLQAADIQMDKKTLESVSGVKIGGDGNPIELINQVHKAVFDERTALNREEKKLRAQREAIKVPEGMEKIKPVSTSELFAERKKMEEQIRENNATRDRFQFIVKRTGEIEMQMSDLQEEIAQLTKEQSEMDPNLQDPDIAAIDEKIAQVDDTNHVAQLVKDREEIKVRLNKASREASRLSENLKAILEYKNVMIAKAKMPIEGLDFEEGGVIYNGIPFEQVSDSEKLKVSMAIAMALNPKIRVIRITDGSLLDSENMKIIQSMAKKKDFQVWIEKVDETGTVGIFIEDGQVKGKKKEKKDGK